MPFALLIIGIVLVVAAVRDSQTDLFNLLKGDFTGPKNFLYWAGAILAIGLLGYVPKMKLFSTTFLVLIVLAIVLANGKRGFFGMLQQQVGMTTSTKPTAPATATPTNTFNPSSIPGVISL